MMLTTTKKTSRTPGSPRAWMTLTQAKHVAQISFNRNAFGMIIRSKNQFARPARSIINWKMETTTQHQLFYTLVWVELQRRHQAYLSLSLGHSSVCLTVLRLGRNPQKVCGRSLKHKLRLVGIAFLYFTLSPAHAYHLPAPKARRIPAKIRRRESIRRPFSGRTQGLASPGASGHCRGRPCPSPGPHSESAR